MSKYAVVNSDGDDDCFCELGRFLESII